MILNAFLTDIVIHIASFDEAAWYRLWQYHSGFRDLHPKIGPIFARTFVRKIDGMLTTLFGKLTSIDDEPAATYSDGQKVWYQNGKLHRPALLWPNGDQEWRQKGKQHRLDGPAVIFADGRQEWWRDGQKITPVISS